MSRSLFAVLAALAIGLPACGDDSERGPSPQPQAARSAEHIHGLGLDERDDTLFIATHQGLFALPEGSRRIAPVGSTAIDAMGFSIASPGHFVASGHPDPADDQPPDLGLIESRDRGRSWQPVSLLGEVDFHVLEAAGERVYGYDGVAGKLLASADGGRRWQRHTLPAPPLDLAIDPRRPRRLVASTERGLFASSDAGAGWRALSKDHGGLLAWPEPRRLVLVAGDGGVHVSRDGGRSWRAAGSIGSQPAALTVGRGELYVALHDGTIKRSSDGGKSWRVRATP